MNFLAVRDRQKINTNSIFGSKKNIITSEREARSEFLLIYTKNLSMSGPPARRPAGRPAVVTLLRGLYLWNRKPD